MSEPVAVALDMLQDEAQAYFGTLLPTIIVANQKLEEMISTRGVLQHYKDYAKALLEGLKRDLSIWKATKSVYWLQRFTRDFANCCG